MTERAPIPMLSKLLVPAVVAAAVAAYFVADHGPAPTSSPAPAVSADPPAPGPVPSTAGLPPNHPPVQGMPGTDDMTHPHGGGMGPMGAAPGGDNQPGPSIKWTAPEGWAAQDSRSPMRLATYKVGDGAELSVVRAGGSTDANVKRWAGQFDGEPKVARTNKQVNGLPVTVVRIDGTFLGGGMGGPPERHDGYTMLAAIVEATGSPYFFKLVGPSAQVDQARKGFDSLIASVSPRPTD
jgi:hypothetical protein